MMKATAAIAAALALACGAAPLAAQDYVAERVVTSVEQTDLIAVVTSLDHTITEFGGPDQTYVAAKTAEGTVYVLLGTACEVEGVRGCLGIMMQVRYDLPAGTTFETLAKTNMGQGALNTGADFEAKSLIFTRYQVLDDGVTMANIRANINVLLAASEDAYPVAAGEK
jgi:hypothetical protein